MVDQKLADNADCYVITRIFHKELVDLSVRIEKLGYIKNFLDNIKDMVTIKKETLISKSRG